MKGCYPTTTLYTVSQTHPEDEVSIDLRNVGTLPHYTTSQPRRILLKLLYILPEIEI